MKRHQIKDTTVSRLPNQPSVKLFYGLQFCVLHMRVDLHCSSGRRVTQNSMSGFRVFAVF
jgi:hypothetical protein